MKTEMTTTLTDLVVKKLNPGARQMSAPQINKWLAELPEIAEGLYRTMSIMVFSPVPDRLVNRHFRQIQHEAICLINSLQGYQDVPLKMQELHLAVLRTLEEVLDRIQTYYPLYFNLDLAIPDSHFKLAINELKANMDGMVNQLNRKCEDKMLRKMILDSMNDFLSANKCTYYRLAYIKGLQTAINELCHATDREQGNEMIRELLITLNLNNNAHVKYYKKIIASQLAETFDLNDQEELLYAYQKQIRSINLQGKTGFSPQNHSIKKVLLDYLNAEISYRRKMKQTYVPGQTQPGNMIWPMPPDPYKLQVAFSVDALAYFLKLAVKAGMINGGPRTQLLNFVSKNFKTLATATISANSLAKKYDQAVHTTATAVRSVLSKMLSQLDADFNLAK